MPYFFCFCEGIPQNLYADHLRKTPTVIKGLIRWVDLWAVSWADGVILVDESRKVQIQGGKPKRLRVINNSPEDVLNQLNTSPQYTTDEELRIVYVGLLQFERGLMELLTVLDDHPEWQHLRGVRRWHL